MAREDAWTRSMSVLPSCARACPRERSSKEGAPEAALEMLRQDLLQHVSGPRYDDAALLMLRYR